MKFVVVQGEQVVRYGNCQPENLSSFARDPGEVAMFSTVWAEGHWWDTVAETLVPKTDLPAVAPANPVPADGETAAVITDVPAGTKVVISRPSGPDEFVTEVDGTVDITSDEPGAFPVMMAHHRHLPWEVVVEFV